MLLTEECINELDTVKFKVDRQNCKFDYGTPEYGSVLGAHYKISSKYIYFTLSCKLFATPTDLGAITCKNYDKIAQLIANNFGIIIYPDYLYTEVNLSRVDVKRDRHMDEEVQAYISDMHRLFKRDTSQYNITKHDSLTYNYGLDLIPKKKSRHRYSTYDKGKEISLYRNKDYREIFDYDYLGNLKNCLRAEIQLEDVSNIRRGFGLGKYEPVTFENIFEKILMYLQSSLDFYLKGVHWRYKMSIEKCY